ncbi:MAG: PD-(D/E)XK nuclease family protein [Treponema sp.]|jgi:CRISPR/Cas system-associated exonuclease Cas4 (RecB family)|nr:PD-(D/E)XK nuclease family protein [Treponema sp.]
MNKSGILDYIAGALEDRRVRFVFPFAIPAEFWAREAALATGRPLDPGRFMAWDRFKEHALSIRQTGRREINRAVRTLFASSLLRENHREFQKGKALLRDYINPDYADSSYSSFIGSIARLLPALDAVLRRPEIADIREDAYFNDLKLIHERYAWFLAEHNLYEPSWNRAAFNAFDEKWLLFYPELAEDWDEYEEELLCLAKDGGDTVRIIPLGAIAAPLYENARGETIHAIIGSYARKHMVFTLSSDEYRCLALLTRRLLDEARLGYEDIVISFAGGGNPERLIQEFRLYDIPVDLRQGKSLVEYPAGRIFTALSACPAQKWSFRSLKNLLLDKAFPWKDKEWIDLLIDFGLQYRCLSGFHEGYHDIDVWEKTFEQHIKRDFLERPVFKLSSFYEQLKKDINAVVNASSFEDLRTAWHIFSRNHFDKAALASDTDKLFARAMRALDALIEIEKQFPGLSAGSAETGGDETGAGGRAFPIFLSYIQEEPYVYQSDTRGVALYDYRVAAGIGPAVCFIINMSQEDATVVYAAGASFLREDRKRLLKIPDRDVSADFIRAYAISGGFPVFTVSLQTFSGSVIPHRRLYDLEGRLVYPKDVLLPESPYDIEAKLGLSEGAGVGGADILPLVSEVQKHGWQARQVMLCPPLGVDLRYTPMNDVALREALRERLGKQILFSRIKRHIPIDDENTSEAVHDLRLSPTDLNEYQVCPFKWLMERGLLIEPKQTEIETIDQKNVGTLYHHIIEAIFRRIQENGDGYFHSALLVDEYQTYIVEETRKAIAKAQMNEGAFQESVYDMLRPRIMAAMRDYLVQADIDGAKVLGAEIPLRREYPCSETALSGKTDLVLQDSAGNLLVLDFKTASLPLTSALVAMDDAEPAIPQDVQMAAYINMIEHGNHNANTSDTNAASPPLVTRARFYSIDNRKFLNVVGQNGGKGKYHLPRTPEEYRREVNGVDALFARVADTVKQGAYEVTKDRGNCVVCTVSSVCRRAFIAVS